MPDRRFEDNVSIDEVLKDNPNNKVLLAKIYVQACKTNNAVGKNDKRISKLEEKCDSFISAKSFTIGASILGLLIILFNVLNYFVGG